MRSPCCITAGLGFEPSRTAWGVATVRETCIAAPHSHESLTRGMLIEAHDQWQDSDRRYLSGESMALLNPPAPTVLEPNRTVPEATTRKEIAATA